MHFLIYILTFSVILLFLFKQIQIFSSLTINDLFFQWFFYNSFSFLVSCYVIIAFSNQSYFFQSYFLHSHPIQRRHMWRDKRLLWSAGCWHPGLPASCVWPSLVSVVFCAIGCTDSSEILWKIQDIVLWKILFENLWKWKVGYS